MPHAAILPAGPRAPLLDATCVADMDGVASHAAEAWSASVVSTCSPVAKTTSHETFEHARQITV